MIIDFHTHITAPGIIARRDEYLVRDAWFRDLYANPQARLSAAGDLIAAMDRAGVDHAVVFGFGWRDMDLCRQVRRRDDQGSNPPFQSGSKRKSLWIFR